MRIIELHDTILNEYIRSHLFQLQQFGILESAYVGGSIMMNINGRINRPVKDIDLNYSRKWSKDELNRIISILNKIAKFIGVTQEQNGDKIADHYKWQYHDGGYVCLYVNDDLSFPMDEVFIKHPVYPLRLKLSPESYTLNAKLQYQSNQYKNLNSEIKAKHAKDITDFYRNIGHPNFK